jgi:hypothetical protein
MPFDFGHFVSRTAMYVSPMNYQTVTAFLCGVDEATDKGLLTGYQEWLVPRVGRFGNHYWPALTLMLAFPHGGTPMGVESLLDIEANNQHAISVLFSCLRLYRKERNAPNGLRKIFLRHEEWLKSTESYDETAPNYFRDSGPWWLDERLKAPWLEHTSSDD